MQVVGCLTLCLNFLHGIKMKIICFGSFLTNLFYPCHSEIIERHRREMTLQPVVRTNFAGKVCGEIKARLKSVWIF